MITAWKADQERFLITKLNTYKMKLSLLISSTGQNKIPLTQNIDYAWGSLDNATKDVYFFSRFQELIYFGIA